MFFARHVKWASGVASCQVLRFIRVKTGDSVVWIHGNLWILSLKVKIPWLTGFRLTQF